MNIIMVCHVNKKFCINNKPSITTTNQVTLLNKFYFNIFSLFNISISILSSKIRIFALFYVQSEE